MTDPRIDARINRMVTAEEIRRALDRRIPSSERDEVEQLIRWFTTRYPTAGARLRYVRQAYDRWRKPGEAPPPTDEHVAPPR
jgi:hypothetical protein